MEGEPMRKSFVIQHPCDDDEIVAMYVIKQVLEPCDAAAKLRILDYFKSRVISESAADNE